MKFKYDLVCQLFYIYCLGKVLNLACLLTVRMFAIDVRNQNREGFITVTS